jgi:hypothetical protein
MPNYESLAASLTDLTNGAGADEMHCTSGQLHTFEQLKHTLASSLVLHQADFAQPFRSLSERQRDRSSAIPVGHYRWADDRGAYIILVQDSIPSGTKTIIDNERIESPT